MSPLRRRPPAGLRSASRSGARPAARSTPELSKAGAPGIARGFLLQVRVSTLPVAEERVAERMAEVLGHACSTFHDLRRGISTASVYLPSARAWTARKQADLKEAIRGLRETGVEVGSGRISARRLPREDWAESWKRHFKPIHIGRALLIKPSWSRLEPKPGQAVIVLDPGLSFGTGQHPTTRFCLEQLVSERRPGTDQSLLDIGTGSGILAIAAARLGYSPVPAFDNDPEAVRMARGNLRTNRVTGQIRLSQSSLETFRPAPKRYQVVCANLIADLLLSEQARLLRLVEKGGVLILAGILSRQFDAVHKAFAGPGARLIARRRQGEWESGAFRIG